MFANTISNKWLENNERVTLTIELIVFAIGEVSFGIPITKINRVISSIFIGEDFSLTQDVEILDLHHGLTGVSLSTPNAIAIFTGERQQLYGIPIDTVPTIVCVPLDRIRTLPDELRHNRSIGIASHIAMVSDSEQDLTVFILAG
jgi:chemotaxis signal transduction protein